MLDKRLKWAFLVVTLIFAGLPIAGIILDIFKPSNIEIEQTGSEAKPARDTATPVEPVKEDMVFIPAGEFLRGYSGEGFDEKLEGRVMLDPYWIERDEVTHGGYMAFVTATGHRKPVSRYVKHFDKLSAPTQPAGYVSWEDADAYCRYRGARLPTEAEWEKAARGSDGLLWPWGNHDKLGAGNTSNPDPYEFPAPVGSFTVDQSPYGVYDMAGNVMEWVADWYGERYFEEAPERNPPSPEHGVFRVLRGGGYSTTGADIRITSRSKMVPDFRDETIGFRCAVSGEKSERN